MAELCTIVGLCPNHFSLPVRTCPGVSAVKKEKSTGIWKTTEFLTRNSKELYEEMVLQEMHLI